VRKCPLSLEIFFFSTFLLDFRALLDYDDD